MSGLILAINTGILFIKRNVITFDKFIILSSICFLLAQTHVIQALSSIDSNIEYPSWHWSYGDKSSEYKAETIIKNIQALTCSGLSREHPK